MTDLRLDGRVAVVTGASGRLGPVWVETLLDAGARVAGLDIHQDAIKLLDDQFAEKRDDCQFLVGDVTDRSSLEAALATLSNRFGTPSVLVNNAGIDQPPDVTSGTSLVQDIDIEGFRRTIDVNLAGTFQATQVFGSAMVDARAGSIVNIGSLYASIAPEPSFYEHFDVDPPFLKPPAYGASKAGVVNLTKYFARLWGPHGVRVNALSPGGVLSDQDDEFIRKYTARTPLRRMAALDDLRGPLAFLASDASRYLTGAELLVDGGFTA